MVKHGKVRANDLMNAGCVGEFKTTIQRNKGHEFNLPLLDTDSASVTFDLVTRDTYTPFGKPDEISFHVIIRCKACGRRMEYSHGRMSCHSGDDHELFQCRCGKCFIQLVFEFRPNGCFDIVDWIPLIGGSARASAAVGAAVLGEEEDARDHWEHAYRAWVPSIFHKTTLIHKDRMGLSSKWPSYSRSRTLSRHCCTSPRAMRKKQSERGGCCRTGKTLETLMAHLQSWQSSSLVQT
eukprot:gb/GFBE01003273.1/.p1 GENE.gb/GFBE01003273.1/~~gb/GFBE01003273.1/.p1  ORF type:complete len:237 (+),score=22.46 gb/GFBE01003273.1/:1-711(+)